MDKTEKTVPMEEKMSGSSAPPVEMKQKFSMSKLVIRALFISVIVMLASIVVGGFLLTNFEHASFYFNTLRIAEDKTMGTNGYKSIDAKKSTMYKTSEMRYFDTMQPGDGKSGDSMAGSYYVTGFPEVFPIGQAFNHRAYSNVHEVMLDNRNAKNRFQVCSLMDKDIVFSYILDTKISKIAPFKEIKKSEINKLKVDTNRLDDWVIELLKLVENVMGEFKGMYGANKSTTQQKYYVKMNDNKEIELSKDLESGIMSIINSYETKYNIPNDHKMTMDKVKVFFKKMGYANPTIRESLVLGKIYNWALFLLSHITVDDLKGIKSIDASVKERDDAKKTFLEQNPNKDPKKALEKSNQAIAFKRTEIIYRAISLTFANLFLSKNTEQKDKFPFSSEKDPRNILMKTISITSPSETTDDAIAILNAVYQTTFSQ